MFGPIEYALASSKAKEKDSKYGHLPSFFTRIFHGYICLEVVTLNTKLTIKTLLKNEEFLLEEIRVFVPQYASLRKY